MRTETPTTQKQAVYLKDYTPPPYLVEKVDLLVHSGGRASVMFDRVVGLCRESGFEPRIRHEVAETSTLPYAVRITGDAHITVYNRLKGGYFVAGLPYAKPYVWMNHPAWYMKGIHLYLRLMGVRALVMGSSGHGGRRALEGVVTWLQQPPAAGTPPSTQAW